jgi:RNA polymerase sigma-70 factor (ECF subfamily)
MDLPGQARAEAPEISEEEISALVLQSQNGDAEAFSGIVAILEPRLHRQALFLTGNEHDALDLLQETLLHGWKYRERFNGRARFFTWLCGIMLHRHYDWRRRMRTRAFAIFTERLDESLAEEISPPSARLEQLERAGLMRGCLDHLPARQRAVVYLRFYAGESLEGIAALVPCSLGTVKSRLFHGLQRLAKMQRIKELQNNESGKR